MARHYSLPDPRRLQLALAALRRKLAPVFTPAKSGKAANAKACKLAA
jgi:hypothetical protein